MTESAELAAKKHNPPSLGSIGAAGRRIFFSAEGRVVFAAKERKQAGLFLFARRIRQNDAEWKKTVGEIICQY